MTLKGSNRDNFEMKHEEIKADLSNEDATFNDNEPVQR